MNIIKTHLVNCLCESVKLLIKGKLRYVSNCHCSQCQKTHGNFAAYTSCNEKNLSFIKNKTLKWYKSSKNAKRGFCSKCGASIFFKKFNTDTISISAGMFTNPTKLKTLHNIFIKGKMDFYTIDNKLPKYNNYSK